jgi:hypothetical protein
MPNLRPRIACRNSCAHRHGSGRNEEAAETLNVSIASLKFRVHRARILFRKHRDVYSSLALLPPPTPTLNPS